MNRDRLPVFDRRRAGVLLPMSALEAALGRGGRAFIDWLAAAGFSVWQILPAGPVGADFSPYWVRSDCAGNPAFLDPAELPDPHAPIGADFLAASSAWLEDYALFEALTRTHGGTPFWRWPVPLRDREPRALEQARRALGAEVERIEREQFAFCVQWQRLRELCPRARRAAVRRPAVLRRPVLGRDLGAPRAVPARPGGRAGQGGRGAAGLLLGARPAVGQPALRLAGAAARRTSPGG